LIENAAIKKSAAC